MNFLEQLTRIVFSTGTGIKTPRTIKTRKKKSTANMGFYHYCEWCGEPFPTEQAHPENASIFMCTDCYMEKTTYYGG